jgi:rod shape-determining protein MreC
MSAYQDNFFTRGPSPLARLTFFALIAIVIMIADHRFRALAVVRLGVSAVLTPIEQVLALPGALGRRMGTYFTDQQRLVAENRELTAKVLELSAAGQQARLVQLEKNYADLLQAAKARFGDRGVIGEIIRDARDPFSRKVIIDKGTSQGIKPGLAVIDGDGVVGQVTAVGLLSAEVTLSTEKDQSVPIMVVRNGLRAVAVGTGRDGMIDVPFIPLGADIQAGDQLVTSGIDGTYPPGLAAATVIQVDKNPALPFAKVTAQPAAAPDHHRFVKVLTLEEIQDYPRPDVGADKKREAGPTGKRDSRRGGR